jgi:hypothetical protein
MLRAIAATRGRFMVESFPKVQKGDRVPKWGKVTFPNQLLEWEVVIMQAGSGQASRAAEKRYATIRTRELKRGKEIGKGVGGRAAGQEVAAILGHLQTIIKAEGTEKTLARLEDIVKELEEQRLLTQREKSSSKSS